MADIKIHREHALGLQSAREVAWQWAEDVESRLQMECTVIEGETSDTVEFKRSGVSGRLIVAADHFDLDARLGFLLGAFSKTIEAEITRNLDSILANKRAPAVADGAAAQKDAPKPAGKAATKSAVKTAAAAKKTSRKA